MTFNEKFSYFLTRWRRTGAQGPLTEEIVRGIISNIITLAEGVRATECLFSWPYGGYEPFYKELMKKMVQLIDSASEEEIAKLERKLPFRIWEEIYDYAPESKLKKIALGQTTVIQFGLFI